MTETKTYQVTVYTIAFLYELKGRNQNRYVMKTMEYVGDGYDPLKVTTPEGDRTAHENAEERTRQTWDTAKDGLFWKYERIMVKTTFQVLESSAPISIGEIK